MNNLRCLSLVLLGCSLALPLSAAESFNATQACPAWQSVAKRTNPDNATTSVGEAYRVIEQLSRQDGDWVRLEVPQASPRERWVSKACGSLVAGSAAVSSAASSGAGQCSTPDRYDSWVLALSWQPTFCEPRADQARFPECRDLEAGRLQVAHLTLHGLWPNNFRQCGINYADCSREPLALQRETHEQLARWMPSLNYNSRLASHEWRKHGTCQTRWDDDEYFLAATRALQMINAAPIGQLIIDNTGRELSLAQLQQAIRDTSASAAAAGSIALLCDRQNQLSELRISLPQDFRLDQGIDGLFGRQPPKASAGRAACRADRPVQIDAAAD